MAANPGPGFLCHKCAKESGVDPFKKATAPRKRKAPGDKRAVTFFEERRLPTLVSLCVKVDSLLYKASSGTDPRRRPFQHISTMSRRSAISGA